MSRGDKATITQMDIQEQQQTFAMCLDETNKFCTWGDGIIDKKE